MYTSRYLNFTVCTKSVHKIQNFHKYVPSAIAILQLRTKTINTNRTGKKCLILRNNMHSLLLMVSLEIHLV